jgi:pyruvate dehydrogenase E2 component (dihydrolipoamide acetyltransferase)
MANEIIMPKFGQTVEEAEIVKWHKKVGDKVAKGDVILEIQTDKATLEVESFHEGTVLKIFAKDGDSVPVMSVIGYIGKEGEKTPDAPPAVEKPKPAEKPAEKKVAPAAKKETKKAAPKPAAKPAAPVATAAPAPVQSSNFSITPRARKLAKEVLVKPERISGSGPNGRIIVRDVEAFLEENGLNDLKITPVAKQLIEENGLDLLDVRGEGKITKDDVQRALREQPKTMSPMRQIIAKRMMESVTTMPHFFVTMKIDVTDMLAYRKRAKASGFKASVGDMLAKAVALTLREMPVMNSVCIGDSVKTNQDVNIGMAVALDDGLIVPVIRNADIIPLDELTATSKDLAKRARENKLSPEDYQGGTFTISNMGMLGVDQFTAIINPGEGAILAVGASVATPVVKKGQVVIRTIMKMTLSSDHRVIDGAVAARFMKSLKNKLEDVGLWQNM